MTASPTFRTGDTGTTARGWPYRVLCVDLDGEVGSLVVAIRSSNGKEYPAQYPATGIHPGRLTYLDLKPPKVRA